MSYLLRTRLQTARKILLLVILCDKHGLLYIPPFKSFARRACKNARQECLNSTTSCIAIAHWAIAKTVAEDVATVAAAIEQPASYYARKFHLERDELANESLVRVLPTIRRRYQPPLTIDENEQRRCLQRYVTTPVYRTAIEFVYGRRQSCRVQSEPSMSHLVDELDVISEIAMRDEYEWVVSNLKEEHRRRVEAIQESSSIEEAARVLGMSGDTLRHWVYSLRRHVGE